MSHRFTVVPDPQGDLGEWMGGICDLPVDGFMLAGDVPLLKWSFGKTWHIPINKSHVFIDIPQSPWGSIRVRAELCTFRGSTAKVRVWHRID